MDQAKVISLDHELALERQICGGKVANLATIFQAGFRVPFALILTVHAYKEFMVTQHMSETVKSEIMHHLLINKWLHIPLAVRSSGISEDSDLYAHAGQWTTILNVVGETGALNAVVQCWQSNYQQNEPMAILIQPMIKATSSGVIFTAHPNTGDRNTVIIHAIDGLGDRLVKGEVIPDEWLNIQDDIRCHHNQHNAIDREEAEKLFQLGKDVEQFFGEPQDIEWCISNDRIYILQSRKITFLPEWQSSMNHDVPKGYWIRETSHFPNPLKPFSLTAMLPMINIAIKEMYDLIPMLIETMELKEIGGHIYGRFVPFGDKDPKPLPLWEMSILSKLDPRLRQRIQACETAMEQDIHFRTIQKWYDQDKSELMIQLERYKAISPADLLDKDLLTHIVELISFVERCYILHMKLNSAYSFVLGEFFVFVKKLLGWESHQILDLFYGLSSQSVEPAREINKLARWATKNPELIRIMDESPIDLMKRIEQVEPKWSMHFEQYLSKYGLRTFGYDVCDHLILERPELVVKIMKEQISTNFDMDRESDIQASKRNRCLQTVHELLKDRIDDLKEFERMLCRANMAYPLREEHGFYDLGMPMALLRISLLELGSRLAAIGMMRIKSDVFFLELNELDHMLLSEDKKEEIQRAISLRKKEWLWKVAHPGPPSYGTKPPESSTAFLKGKALLAHHIFGTINQLVYASNPSPQYQTHKIQGIAASAGTYTGIVKIAMNENEWDKIYPGAILVCPIVPPGWSILFSNLGALITDSGGTLSHTAIVAREYNLPAVVATENATSRLTDGQMVTVNGSTGQVTWSTSS